MRLTRRMVLSGTVALSTAAFRGNVRSRASGTLRYAVRELGALTGVITDSFRPYGGVLSGINSAGEVGGALVVSAVKVAPAIWSVEGKQRRLKSGTFGGEVTALNASGLAVGLEFQSVLGIEKGDSPLTSYQTRYLPAAWQDDEPIALAFPDGMDADPTNLAGMAFDVNEQGQIVGFCRDRSQDLTQPVVWRDGAIETLLPMSENGDSVRYYHINASGTVVGSIVRTLRFPDGTTYPFFEYPAVWKDGKLEVLALPDEIIAPRSLDKAFFSLNRVFGISDDGLLLAWFTSGAVEGQSSRTYLFDRGQWIPLTSPSEDHPNILAQGISPTGVVVGTVATGHMFNDPRQVVWTDGSPREITGSIPDLKDDLSISRLLAINSSGEILANAYDPNRTVDGYWTLHGFVLTPE